MKLNHLHQVILLLGSNQGERLKNLGQAAIQIEKHIGNISLASSIYETEPWGFRAGECFLNQALLVQSADDPPVVLNAIQGIEKQMGRGRKLNYYASRTIDIDILFFDKLILNKPDLVIPHPLIPLRKFVLVPLTDIVPNFEHPVIKLTIKELHDQCEDALEVSLYQSFEAIQHQTRICK